MSYISSVVIVIGINLIAVVGLTYFTGFTGLFSFGHAGFVAIGAYTSAIFYVTLGVPLVFSLLAGMLFAGLAAFLIGMPTSNIKGTYFAIVAMGFGEVIRILLIVLKGVTKGAQGFSGIPLKTTAFLVVLLSVVSVWLVVNLVHSPLGRASRALKTDEVAAQSCGIPLRYIRIFALIISAVFCGLAGGLTAFYQTYLSPDMFDIDYSSQLCIAVLVGGLGSVSGPVTATILLFGLPEVLRFLSAWRMTIYGVIVVLTILIRPEGLFSGMKPIIKFGPGFRISLNQEIKSDLGKVGKKGHDRKAEG